MNMAKVGYLRRSYTFLSEQLGPPHIQIRGLYINQYRNQCRGLGMRFCWALVSTKNCLKLRESIVKYLVEHPMEVILPISILLLYLREKEDQVPPTRKEFGGDSTKVG